MSAELFCRFWSEYPRRVARKAAIKAFERCLSEGENAEEIIAGAARYRAHIANNNIDVQFVKHPTTFLNQGCWSDEYTLNLPERTAPEVYPGETLSAALRRKERLGLKVV